MIEITYEPNIPRITLSGHAYHDEYGKDIVCASVSALSLTLADVIDKDGKVSVSSGYVLCEGKEKHKPLFDFVYHGIKRIEEQYPENLHSVTSV